MVWINFFNFLFFHHSSPTNFFSQPNGKWFNSRKKKIKKIYPDHFVPNLILYKTVRIKIRDYFALVTSFKLKKPPYRNVGYIGINLWYMSKKGLSKNRNQSNFKVTCTVSVIQINVEGKIRRLMNLKETTFPFFPKQYCNQ